MKAEMISPLNVHILVRVIEQDSGETNSGILLEPKETGYLKGTIVTVPHTVDAQKGNTVLFKRWAGEEVEEGYKLLKESDLLARYEVNTR